MKLLAFLCPALLAILSVSPLAEAGKKPPSKNAILLSQVKTLTLRSNAKTTHRRVSAIPQLTCKGPGCSHYNVEVMRCTNQGSAYNSEDIEWSCVANMPDDFKLGSTDVICEGYSSPEDEYVLKGSCGVEYRLLLTDKGEEKYSHKWGSGGGSSGEGWTWGSVLFIFIFLGVLGWIIYSAYTALPNAGARRFPRQPGGGFWGGGWGGGPPPPPYDGPPPPYSRKNYGTSGEGWRPGFWSGTAAGAAAGYLAGSRGGRQQEPVHVPQQRSGGWFGGGGGDSGNNRSPAGPSRSGSSSSARHESTGFGSTSRR